MSRKLTRAEQEAVEAMPDFSELSSGKKTFGERLSDFVADNKFFFILGAALLVLVAVALLLFSSSRVDLKVMIVSDNSVLTEDMAKQLPDFLSYYVYDIDDNLSQNMDIRGGFYRSPAHSDIPMSESESKAEQAFSAALSDSGCPIFIADTRVAKYLADGGYAMSLAKLTGNEKLGEGAIAIKVGDSGIFAGFHGAQSMYFEFLYSDDGFGAAFVDYYIMVNAAAAEDETQLTAAREFVKNVLSEMSGSYLPDTAETLG